MANGSGLGDIIGGGGGALASLFGSDAPPKAILNRFAAPTAKAGGKLSTDLLTDVNQLSKDALDTYMGGQPKFLNLAGQQENLLNTIGNRQMGYDPNAFLQQIGKTAFSFIDPNVLNPLATRDVNADILSRRARGLNPAAVDSTADRLRNARIASGRYYDVARDAYQALPNLFGQGFNQGQAALQAAQGIIPQIAQAYEGVYARPTQGLLNRISTAQSALGAGGQGIGNINAATQGFQQPRNWADRIGAASQDIGRAAEGVASLAGGGGGGGGGL